MLKVFYKLRRTDEEHVFAIFHEIVTAFFVSLNAEELFLENRKKVFGF